MNTESKPKAGRRKRPAIRILKWALVVAAVLLVLIVLVVPPALSSDSFRRFVLSKINNSLQGRADFADLSVGWFKGVRLEDISFDDNDGFVSVRVKRIATRPRYAKLLAGSLSFGRTTISRPSVEINLKKRRAPAPVPALSTPQSSSVPTQVAIAGLVTELKVDDGSFKLTDSKSQMVKLSKINSQVSLQPPGRQSTFEVNMAVVAKDKEAGVRLAGAVTTPKTQKKTGWTLKGADGQLTVEVNELDIETLAPFFELADVNVTAKGIISADLKGRVTKGRIQNLDGKLSGNNLQITAPALKGDTLGTTKLDAEVKITRQDKAIKLDRCNLATDWADLELAGVVPEDAGGQGYAGYLRRADLAGKFNCDLAALASQLPNTIGLKEDAKITSGRLAAGLQTASLDGKKQVQLYADLVDLKGVVKGQQVSLSQPVKARAQVSVGPESRDKKPVMSFEAMEVTASFAQFNCTGTTEKLDYHADIDLGKLQAELGQFIDLGGYRMAGRMVEAGRIATTGKKISASGSGQITGLSITSPNDVTVAEPKAELHFDLDVDKEQNLLALKSVKADATFGRLSITDGLVPLARDAAKPMNLTLAAEGLNLAKLQPFAVMFASLPQDIKLAGIADASIVLASQEGLYKITTDNATIKNFELGSAGKKPFKEPEVRLTADVELNPSQKTYAIKKLAIQGGRIKLDYSSVSLSTEKGQSNLVGQARFDYDCSAVGEIASIFLPKPISLSGQRTTSVDFSSRFPADRTDRFLAGLNTSKCSLGFDRAEYMGLEFGPTELSVYFKDGVLKVDPFTTAVNNGMARLAAYADFTQARPLLGIPEPITVQSVQINQTLARNLLAYVNPIFADAVDARGVVNFSAESLVIPLRDTDPNDVELVGTIGIDDILMEPKGFASQLLGLIGKRRRQTRMKVHPTKITLKNGLLQYAEAMRFDVDDMSVLFKGAVSLADQSLNMNVGVPVPGLADKLSSVPLGAATIWGKLTGKTNKPKFSITNPLQGLPQNAVKGLLDGLFQKRSKPGGEPE